MQIYIWKAIKIEISEFLGVKDDFFVGKKNFRFQSDKTDSFNI